MKKIAVIGSGGREHAISWKLQKSRHVQEVITIPGNGGIPNSISVNSSDFGELEKYCKNEQIDWLFVGPEIPLSEGIVDYFSARGIPTFGPEKQAAKLESSKIFAKKFMQKYKVATADFSIFHHLDGARDYLRKIGWNAVIKYDGLAGGKGVFVCQNQSESERAIQELEAKFGSEINLVIEEKLIGEELSIIGFTDGKTIKTLLPSQDHKQLLEGDQGPNTGGMGAFCPVPFVDSKLMQKIGRNIIQPTMQGIQQENFNYIGVLYFGLIITSEGPKILEYNVRFGDPETEVLLPLLETDLAEIIEACFQQKLEEIEFKFKPGYCVDVVLISDGYPRKYHTGFPISGLDKFSDDLIFHAGTTRQDNQLITAGGRVLNVVAQAPNLEEAIQKSYALCDQIHFSNKKFRKDIGMRNKK